MSCDLTIAFKVKLEWKKAISDRQNNYVLDEYSRIPRNFSLHSTLVRLTTWELEECFDAF